MSKHSANTWKAKGCIISYSLACILIVQLTSSSLFMKSDCGKNSRDDIGNNNKDWMIGSVIPSTNERELDKLTEKDQARKSERERHSVTDN